MGCIAQRVRFALVLRLLLSALATTTQGVPVLRFPWSAEFHASPLALLRAAAVALACGATLVMAGCTSTGVKTFGVQENFGSVATYSRLFDAAPA